MNKPPRSVRSRILWSVLFFAIAFLSVYTIVSQNRSFSLSSFLDYISGASIPYVVMAVLCMVGFIVFEGEAVLCVCRAFGYPSGHGSALVWSASDIYFSAITPSATGGQPACAWFMIRDGIPPLIATLALIVNLTMYTASILVLGILTAVIQPGVFLSLGTVSKILILVGFLIQALLGVFFVALIAHRRLLYSICRKGLHLICKLRILRHEEARQESLARHMEDYAMYASMILQHRSALIKAFVYNLLQRVCVISVPFFLFLSSGGGFGSAARIWAVQCFTVLGSNAVPIPGAMGVSDYMMLDGFSNFLPGADVVDFELLSRGISFYICVLLCGSLTLIRYLLLKKRERYT